LRHDHREGAEADLLMTILLTPKEWRIVHAFQHGMTS
jgi:hypothetical protein